MAHVDRERNRDRLKATIGVAAFHALLGYGLIAGLGFEVPKEVRETFKVFDVPQEPPPPPPLMEEPPPEPKNDEAEGEASPPNLRSRPTPVVAPPPKVRVPVEQELVTVDKPLPGPPGNDPTAGSSTVAGPGTGSGGVGNGTGSGGSGTGTGSGGGGTGAQRLRGGFTRDDYARLARGEPLNVSVAVGFTVQPDGRVTNCVVRRSSGRTDVDGATCRLIEQRFFYRPARDAQGRPISAILTSTFYWEPR